MSLPLSPLFRPADPDSAFLVRCLPPLEPDGLEIAIMEREALTRARISHRARQIAERELDRIGRAA